MSETVPALVGRKEAGQILGVEPENMKRMKDVPPPLQARKIRGFDVGATPLWLRSEIVAVATARKRAARAAQREREQRVREKAKRVLKRQRA